MNENPSVRIELARSKTSNNGPLRNRSVVSIARLYVYSKIVCFYESDYAFKTIWRRPCSCHLVKINRYFFQPGRPVFVIVINTSCSSVCYRIYGRQSFLNNALAPNGALALFGIFAGRISCNKRPHTQYLLLQYISIDFNSSIPYVPQYLYLDCFVKKFKINIQRSMASVKSRNTYCALLSVII